MTVTDHPVAAASRWGRAVRAARRRGLHGRDLAALVATLVLIGVAAAVGRHLLRAGSRMNLPAPPLFAFWKPHLGPGSAAAVLVAVAGVAFGPRLSARLGWRPLLVVGYLTALAWTTSLALVDGWNRGWVMRLSTSDEYLHDLPRITDIGPFLSGFSSHIVDYQPDSWTTHVSSHPPLATLVFWALDRVGLHGGGWAGLLVVLVGSSAGIAVAVTLRAFGAEGAARRVLPALVLFPGAVWVGVSADGLFAGVAAWGIALSALGVTRRVRSVALVGGLLLGSAVYLSYGLALLVFPVLACAALTLRLGDRRDAVGGWLWVVAGAGAVAAAFTVAGFDWLEGERQLVIRYYQGIASSRPYGYFVWANLAALALAAGPAVAAGIGRAVPLSARITAEHLRAATARSGRVSPSRARLHGRTERLSPARAVPAILATAALLAVLVADATGLSKAETERIWLPFGIWLIAGLALLPARATRWVLCLQVLTALTINHLTLTNW